LGGGLALLYLQAQRKQPRIDRKRRLSLRSAFQQPKKKKEEMEKFKNRSGEKLWGSIKVSESESQAKKQKGRGRPAHCLRAQSIEGEKRGKEGPGPRMYFQRSSCLLCKGAVGPSRDRKFRVSKKGESCPWPRAKKTSSGKRKKCEAILFYATLEARTPFGRGRATARDSIKKD